MNSLKDIKWYHILILCLSAILLFLLITRNNCPQTMCTNAPQNSEAFKTGKDKNHQNKDHQNKNHQNKNPHKITGEIMFYYTNWCGFCKQFKPEWEKFEKYAKSSLPHLKVSEIKCEGRNETVCNQKGVSGFPTIILYPHNGPQKVFNGPRTIQGVVEFVNQHS